MSRALVQGHVSREVWEQVGRDDAERRAALRESDFGGSILTAVAGVLMLAMLATGPMWTAIHFWSTEDGHGPLFERLWLVPLGFTLAAAVPLAWAIRRERTGGRWALAAFLVASLAIQLATCPWL